MGKPNGIPEDDDGRGELAKAVRSKKKADPSVPAIERMRLIVKECQANRIDGVLVDLFTASCCVQVYDAANEQNREKLRSFRAARLVDVTFKVLDRVRA